MFSALLWIYTIPKGAPTQHEQGVVNKAVCECMFYKLFAQKNSFQK